MSSQQQKQRPKNPSVLTFVGLQAEVMPRKEFRLRCYFQAATAIGSSKRYLTLDVILHT